MDIKQKKLTALQHLLHTKWRDSESKNTFTDEFQTAVLSCVAFVVLTSASNQKLFLNYQLSDRGREHQTVFFALSTLDAMTDAEDDKTRVYMTIFSRQYSDRVLTRLFQKSKSLLWV